MHCTQHLEAKGRSKDAVKSLLQPFGFEILAVAAIEQSKKQVQSVCPSTRAHAPIQMIQTMLWVPHHTPKKAPLAAQAAARAAAAAAMMHPTKSAPWASPRGVTASTTTWEHAKGGCRRTSRRASELEHFQADKLIVFAPPSFYTHFIILTTLLSPKQGKVIDL